MAVHATEPRDLRSEAEPGNSPRQPPAGRWEREAQQHPEPGPEDSATQSSRIFFFVILAVIAASFAVFLVLRPQ